AVESKPLTLSQKSLYAGPSTRQGGGCCVWPISWNSIFFLWLVAKQLNLPLRGEIFPTRNRT
ncbi:MAG: hypothetical protein MK294_03025, partial [Rhodospirillales bacterium]|nr:hypothetical protein [Rhodospirillales bacterium]